MTRYIDLRYYRSDDQVRLGLLTSDIDHLGVEKEWTRIAEHVASVIVAMRHHHPPSCARSHRCRARIDGGLRRRPGARLIASAKGEPEMT